ncbi:MAG: GNAT family N-acetyltransferase [Crocinitomicaceae bacterium]|nr:GNAT family N-acetyltransferase [Crocinitomicaceae bacterium]NDC92263.1 GNAT family N-acetyltransferase [Flavobacteriales bacterium]
MEIRLLQKHELSLTQNLAEKIWPSAYGTILSKEQLSYMLNWMYSIETLEKSFDKGNEFYCAFDNDLPLGFLELEFLSEETSSVKLQKIYVLPSEQNKGIGKKFLQLALLKAKNRGARNVILQVNRANKAVQFYLKNNFCIIREEDFPIGNGYYMNDYVMEKTLV